jgi:hypothetical protein
VKGRGREEGRRGEPPGGVSAGGGVGVVRGDEDPVPRQPQVQLQRVRPRQQRLPAVLRCVVFYRALQELSLHHFFGL